MYIYVYSLCKCKSHVQCRWLQFLNTVFLLHSQDEGKVPVECATPLSPDHEAPLRLEEEFKKTSFPPSTTGAPLDPQQEYEVVCEASETAPEETRRALEELRSPTDEEGGRVVGGGGGGTSVGTTTSAVSYESPPREREDRRRRSSNEPKIVSVRQRRVTAEEKKTKDVEEEDEFATMRRIPSPVEKEPAIVSPLTKPQPSVTTTSALPPLPPLPPHPPSSSSSVHDSPSSSSKKHQFIHSPKFALRSSHTSLGSTSSFGSMGSVYSFAGTKGNYDCTGSILFGVSYSSGSLDVHINRARGLAAANKSGFSDPYIKTYLLPDKSKHSKQKTNVKKRTLDPVYNETLKVEREMI